MHAFRGYQNLQDSVLGTIEGESPLYCQPWLARGTEDFTDDVQVQKSPKDHYFQHWQLSPTLPPKDVNLYETMGFTSLYIGLFNAIVAKEYQDFYDAAILVTKSQIKI